jgi:hypothetical protein
MMSVYSAVRAESLTVMQDMFSISVSPQFFTLHNEMDNNAFVFSKIVHLNAYWYWV